MSALAQSKTALADNAHLTRIRLEPARTSDYSSGSPWHGYEFVVPLTEDGHVDAKSWSRVNELCHVVRFWGDDSRERGQFVRLEHDWSFKYAGSDHNDRETFFKLDRHRFVPGGYVMITERDGRQTPFRIVAMTAATIAN